MIAIGAQLSEQIALSYIWFNYLSLISSRGYHLGVLEHNVTRAVITMKGIQWLEHWWEFGLLGLANLNK